MAKKKVFNFLPDVFKTETQRRFFDATFEQLFSQPDSEHVNGYIGHRSPGIYTPLKDYYVAQSTSFVTIAGSKEFQVLSNVG